jgi:hypothetical protein
MADLCGAKTRLGGTCKKAPIAGKTRCCLHEELSVGDTSAHEHQCEPCGQDAQIVQGAQGTNNEHGAIAHGFYADALQPDELDLWARIEIGSLDDEIRLMKMKLRRLVRLADSQELADLTESALDTATKALRKSDAGEGGKEERESESGEESQNSKAAVTSGKAATAGSRSSTRSAAKTAAAHYADLIIKALDQIRKLERARIGLKLAEGDGLHGAGLNGFVFIVKRAGCDDA